MNTPNLSSPAIKRSAAPLSEGEPIIRTLPVLRSGSIFSNNDAQWFARAWVSAWNSRDLERLAAMYADRCELSSPLVVFVMGTRSGRLFGKGRIITFWKRLCARQGKIDHELFSVYRGVKTIAISYRSFLGKNALELMELDESGRIIRSTSSFDQMS